MILDGEQSGSQRGSKGGWVGVRALWDLGDVYEYAALSLIFYIEKPFDIGDKCIGRGNPRRLVFMDGKPVPFQFTFDCSAKKLPQQ